MPDIRTYVINLDRAPERLAVMETQLQALRLPYERIAALDAANVTEAIVSSVTAPRLQRCRDSSADAALVFEDDAEIDADIADVVDAIHRLPPRADRQALAQRRDGADDGGRNGERVAPVLYRLSARLFLSPKSAAISSSPFFIPSLQA
jgi:GR25 family glycosyltransferase involved in LPS biosynthesis